MAQKKKLKTIALKHLTWVFPAGSGVKDHLPGSIPVQKDLTCQGETKPVATTIETLLWSPGAASP